MSFVVTSKWAGRCQVCKQSYGIGTQVTKENGKWGHVRCMREHAVLARVPQVITNLGYTSSPIADVEMDYTENEADYQDEELPAETEPEIVEPKKKFIPSQYQMAIFRWIVFGVGNAVVEAVAGSGKSTTCVQAVQYLPLSVAYHTGKITEAEALEIFESGDFERIKQFDSLMDGLDVGFFAFNKHIAAELGKRLPTWCYSATLHSLGYADLRQSLGNVRVEERDRWDILFNDYPLLQIPKNIRQLSKEEKAKLYTRRDSFKNLVALAKATLVEADIREDVLDMIGYYGIDLEENTDYFIGILPKVLEKCKENTNLIDFDDMQWLPIVLNLPLRKFDFLFVDETQDLNNNQTEFVLRSLKSTGRAVCVGDSRQCQPPGTRVMVFDTQSTKKEIANYRWVSIENLESGGSIATFDRHSSSIIKAGKVNEIASRYYSGDMYKISAGGRVSRSTPNHKWLVRWNKKSANCWALYMMRQGNRFRVGVTKMFRKETTSAGGIDFGLGQRARCERADQAWILELHKTSEDARVAEAIVSAKYGIPQTTFYPPVGGGFTKKSINKIFNGISNIESKAILCLSDYGRDIDFPLYSCESRTRQGRKTLFETQACNLLSKYMSVPVAPDGQIRNANRSVDWVPLEVSRYHYSGKVYSLDVAVHHKYVSDGIITCNSLYGFRGANVDAMENIVKALNATVLPLSITYRCPASHVRWAKELVPQIEARDDAPEGMIVETNLDVMATKITRGDMVVCRTNAPLVPVAFGLIRKGVKATIRGRDIGKNLSELANNIANGCGEMETFFYRLSDYSMREMEKLQNRRATETQIQALEDKVDTLRAVAGECNEPKDVAFRIQEIFSDENGEVVLSSVHRAKGLESKNVWILRPELMPFPRAKQDWEKQQEMNIKYVAITRSLDNLYLVREQ